MKAKCFVVFISLLLLLFAVPRAHCLCHDHDVLVVGAGSLDCCEQDNSHKVSNSISNQQDESCFVGADTNEQATGAVFSMPGIAVVTFVQAWSDFISDDGKEQSVSAIAARAPPPRHPPGIALHLFNCVLLT